MGFLAPRIPCPLLYWSTPSFWCSILSSSLREDSEEVNIWKLCTSGNVLVLPMCLVCSLAGYGILGWKWCRSEFQRHCCNILAIPLLLLRNTGPFWFLILWMWPFLHYWHIIWRFLSIVLKVQVLSAIDPVCCWIPWCSWILNFLVQLVYSSALWFCLVLFYTFYLFVEILTLPMYCALTLVASLLLLSF